MQDRYILLTAAKNEERDIGAALQSVVRQSILPVAWFIVDDGSTDRTAHIIKEYAEKHPFIRLRSRKTGAQRDFGAKDRAVNAAYVEAREMAFDFIGVQDADIAPERDDYYESMLREFDRNPKLGITGGYIYERCNGVWGCRRGNSADSVAGGIQLFRRLCFEQMGGYTPLPLGGEDWLAQLNAKMSGWSVQAFPDYHVFHYRPTSSAGGRWCGLMKLGMMDASFGSDLYFEILKCCRRMRARPYVVGGLVRFLGYARRRLSGQKPVLSKEQVAYLRREQRAKMGQFWRQLIG